jgi:hypothetical protein
LAPREADGKPVPDLATVPTIADDQTVEALTYAKAADGKAVEVPTDAEKADDTAVAGLAIVTAADNKAAYALLDWRQDAENAANKIVDDLLQQPILPTTELLTPLQMRRPPTTRLVAPR